MSAVSRFGQALTDCPIVSVLFLMTSVTYWNLTKRSAKCCAASREETLIVLNDAQYSLALCWPPDSPQWHINIHAQFTLLLFLCLLPLCVIVPFSYERWQLQPKLLFFLCIYVRPLLFKVSYRKICFCQYNQEECPTLTVLLMALCQQVKTLFF